MIVVVILQVEDRGKAGSRPEAVVPDAVLALPEAVALCMRREEPVLAAARGDGFTIARLKEAMGTAKDIH